MSGAAPDSSGSGSGSGSFTPGEVIAVDGWITINEDAPRTTLQVVNTGDRPVQVGSHYHFAQANLALSFDRAAAYGQRLDIAAGTAVRFEPGVDREVNLVPIRGTRVVPGLTMPPPNSLDHEDPVPADPDLPGGLVAPELPNAPVPLDVPASEEG